MGISLSSYSKGTGFVDSDHEVGMTYSNGGRMLRILGMTAEAEELCEEYAVAIPAAKFLYAILSRPARVAPAIPSGEGGTYQMVMPDSDECWYATRRDGILMVAAIAASLEDGEVRMS